MLKPLLLLLCLFSGLLTLNAQKKMNLYFKDGSIKTGYVTFKKSEVKYQEKKKGRKEKFDYEILDSAASPVNPRAKRQLKPKTVYFLAEGKKGKKVSVFDLVSSGKVNLYKKTTMAGYQGVWLNTGGGGAGNIFIPSAPSKKITIYALRRESEPNVTILGGKDTSVAFIKLVDSFKNHSEEYFSDCPALVENIKEEKKGFKQSEIKKIAAFYNTQCN